MIELIFIGRKFYKESSTIMSPIYKVTGKGKYERYDYGFLQIDIEKGLEIHIRKATDKELEYFNEKLINTQIKWGVGANIDYPIYEATEDTFKAIAEEFGNNIHIAGGP